MNTKSLLAILLLSTATAFSQTTTEVTMVQRPNGTAPVYMVVETSRSAEAVNYEHRSGSTKVDFVGTSLMPSADGHAKVESKRGTMQIGAEFAGLPAPTTFGPEYLTYVMWAISPEGRAFNLGEVLVGDNNRSKLTATSNLQSFALIVTAEPYFAVREPSNVVVLENVVRDNTKGTTEPVQAKYELMERGGYLPTGYKFDPIVINQDLPLEFYEARNAVRIAQSEGAETYAADSYRHAVQLMDRTDSLATRGHDDRKPLIAAARETVQTAEDSREIAVRKITEMRLADERQASINAQANAQSQAYEANLQKQKAQTDAANAQSDAAAAQAAMLVNQAQANAAVNAANANAANANASMIATQQASAAALTAAAQEKQALRVRLMAQLNDILQTRDSARGLIVSMSDVLFDSGQFTLKPGAREKLAKVAGILLAYPSLNIKVGGYTDNVGGDAMNLTLSENRANTVRDYLVQQGVASPSVTAEGYGDTMPVATNDSSAGRQQNRRVELLVSGDAIGVPTDTTTSSLQ